MIWQKLLTGIYLMVIGMGVVFLSLYLLMLVINGLGWIQKKLEKKHSKPVIEPETTAEGMTPEEAAVIAAAATEALAAKVEVQQIRLLQDNNQDAWSRMGRLDIMRSHNIHTPDK